MGVKGRADYKAAAAERSLRNDGIILYSIVVIDAQCNAFVKPTELYTTKSEFYCMQIFEKNQPDWQKQGGTPVWNPDCG